MSDLFSYLTEIKPVSHNLIRGLQLIQKEEGFLSDDSIIACGKYFGTSSAEVEGVVSFYSQFKRTKPGKYQVSVCDGTACHIKGTSLIVDWISTDLGIADGETDEAGLFSLETVACLGCCSLAPVLAVNKDVYGNLDRKQTLKILKRIRKKNA